MISIFSGSKAKRGLQLSGRMQAFKESFNLEVRKCSIKVKAVKPNQTLKQKLSSKKNIDHVERLKKRKQEETKMISVKWGRNLRYSIIGMT